MRQILPITLAFLVSLSACATPGTGPGTRPGPTPFEPATGARLEGFSDQKIETDRYRILFQGNSRTTRQRVEDSLLLRAADLTLEQGYDWFQIVNRATDAKTTDVTYPGHRVHFGYGAGFATYSRWSPRFGWVAVHDRFWDPFYDPFFDRPETRQITRFQASAEILLGKGSKPDARPDAFNARDVKANLTPRVVPAMPAPPS